MRTILSFAIVALVVGSLSVALRAASADDPPPGSIKLLDGFKHQRMQGIDTRVGKIWKENGITIQYDIGRLAGNYAQQQRKYQADQLVWDRQQTWHGEPVELAMTKNRQLYVSFPESHANFYGQVQKEEDLVDALLMVLMYVPAKKAER
ncbi:MAG: hypothetical protein IH889_07130 [Planctomycetes bacterium]|nr:hypothetical protein [Planctomycetota bacterium]